MRYAATGLKFKSILLVLFFLTAQGIGQDKPYPLLKTDHFKLKEAGLDLAKEIAITGIDFLSDGKMVVLTWGGKKESTNLKKGKVFILSHFGKGDTGSIVIKQIADSLHDPVGMKVVDDVIYVSHKPGMIKLTRNGDSYIRETLMNVNFTGNYHEYHYGIVHKDGYLYTALGQPWSPKAAEERGAYIRTRISDGIKDTLADGLREPNGIGQGPAGEIFASDNQGHWLPHSKLVHLTKNSFYGFENKSGAFNNMKAAEQKPPALWLPHNQVANSPTQPIFIPYGTFKGQMYVGEHTQCRLLRVFLERVDSVWQGAVFYALDKNQLASSPNRFVWGPDSALYMGGTSGLTGWGSACGNTPTVTRIQAVTGESFEMKAIRSTASGFEIEFTSPVDKGAEVLANYNLDRWGYLPVYSYGSGNKLNERKVNIIGINVSGDKTKVTVTIDKKDLQHDPDVMPSTVFIFSLNNIKSSKGDSLWSNQAWYTLNKAGPAEINGCMDKNYSEYNSLAAYDDGLQCRTKITALRQLERDVAHSIPIVQSGKAKVLIDIPYSSDISVSVTNFRGDKVNVFPRNLSGKLELSLPGNPPGLYVLKINIEKQNIIKKVILY